MMDVGHENGVAVLRAQSDKAPLERSRMRDARHTQDLRTPNQPPIGAAIQTTGV